ncbi:MAG: DUF4367 domain-containing protein [Clostridia bacterium]|nr:DUF4367 domain-containing protein [Clostridia bacterium]
MNDNFKKALTDSINAEFNDLIPETDSHTFSPRFEKKMKKLINQRKKPYYKLINTFGKRVACITLTIIVASSITVMSSEALRTRFKGFFIQIENTHSTIKSDDKANCPDTIEEIYEITYDLSDFTVEFEDYDEYDRHTTYKKGNIIISFYQHSKPSYDVDYNTEDAEIQEIEINEIKGLYFLDNKNYDHLIWDNGDYIFNVNSNIGKDELIKIAESVQKIESEQ